MTEDTELLRSMVAENHADTREDLARIAGQLATLNAIKSADHDRLDARIDTLAGQRREANRTLQALHTRLDAYPQASDVREGLHLARVNQLTLAKLSALALAAGAGGGVGAQLLTLVT